MIENMHIYAIEYTTQPAIGTNSQQLAIENLNTGHVQHVVENNR